MKLKDNIIIAAAKRRRLFNVVGAVRLELMTSTMSTWRSDQLSYVPFCSVFYIVTYFTRYFKLFPYQAQNLKVKIYRRNLSKKKTKTNTLQNSAAFLYAAQNKTAARESPKARKRALPPATHLHILQYPSIYLLKLPDTAQFSLPVL